MAQVALMNSRLSWASALTLPLKSCAKLGLQGLSFLMSKMRTAACVVTKVGLVANSTLRGLSAF